MRIHFSSDWHTDGPDYDAARYWPTLGEVQVLPGDIVRSPVCWVELLPLIPEMPTVIVLGNHEFYGLQWPDAIATYRELLRPYPHVHLLERNAVVIDGVRFLGTVLWTDLNGGRDAVAAVRAVSVFRWIRTPAGPFTSDDFQGAHAETVQWLRRALTAPFPGPTVVVTHHAPSRRSRHPRFADSPVSSAFTARLDALIHETRPTAWIHGHVHAPVRYRLGDTWVLSNPMGYRGEGIIFDPEACIEV